MKSSLLIQFIAVPAILAHLLGLDIVYNSKWEGVEGVVTRQGLSEEFEKLSAQDSGGIKFWCLEDDQWTVFCNNNPKSRQVQVLGHLDFDEPTVKPWTVDISIPDPDPELNSTWTTACHLNATGKGNESQLIWDVLKGQRGLLDYTLVEGFESKAIEIKCDGFWVNTMKDNKFEYGLDLSEGGYWSKPAG